MSPWTQKAEGRSGRLAEKALYCALEEIAHRFFRAPAARRSDFVCAPCGRAFSPLSVTAQSAVTPPPRGEASVPASITTKFVVRQSHKKSSPYHKVSRCPRACTWLSLRESWRGAPERGASPACGRGAAAGGGEGQNGKGSKTQKRWKKHKYTKFPPPTPKIPSRACGAKRAGKIGNKEKKAKTKNL
mgnify:CR=1 FL=1